MNSYFSKGHWLEKKRKPPGTGFEIVSLILFPMMIVVTLCASPVLQCVSRYQ